MDNKFSNISSPGKRQDQLGNLVLLNESINKKIKNDFFEVKRNEIIKYVLEPKNHEEKGIYILPCTERVYLKFYNDDIFQNTVWNEQDAEKYMKAIETELNNNIKRGSFRVKKMVLKLANIKEQKIIKRGSFCFKKIF